MLEQLTQEHLFELKREIDFHRMLLTPCIFPEYVIERNDYQRIWEYDKCVKYDEDSGEIVPAFYWQNRPFCSLALLCQYDYIEDARDQKHTKTLTKVFTIVRVDLKTYPKLNRDLWYRLWLTKYDLSKINEIFSRVKVKETRKTKHKTIEPCISELNNKEVFDFLEDYAKNTYRLRYGVETSGYNIPWSFHETEKWVENKIDSLRWKSKSMTELDKMKEALDNSYLKQFSRSDDSLEDSIGEDDFLKELMAHGINGASHSTINRESLR